MSPFHTVLRTFRERAGITANRLAKLGNVNSAYIYRMERPAGQIPRRDLLNSLISALQLNESDSECLLVAAGYCPEAIARLGSWDETLGVVAHVLADDALTEKNRAEFRGIVTIVASVLSDPSLSDSDREEFHQIVLAVARRWMKSE
jgi:hypothetical protein